MGEEQRSAPAHELANSRFKHSVVHAFGALLFRFGREGRRVSLRRREREASGIR